MDDQDFDSILSLGYSGWKRYYTGNYSDLWGDIRFIQATFEIHHPSYIEPAQAHKSNRLLLPKGCSISYQVADCTITIERAE